MNSKLEVVTFEEKSSLCDKVVTFVTTLVIIVTKRCHDPRTVCVHAISRHVCDVADTGSRRAEMHDFATKGLFTRGKIRATCGIRQ